MTGPEEEGRPARHRSPARAEEAFNAVLDTMLGPDLAAVGATASNVLVGPVLAMAIPGQDAP